MGSESVCHLQQDTHFPHLHSSPSLYTHACTTRTGFFFFFLLRFRVCRVFGLHTQSLPLRGPDRRGRGQARLSEGELLPTGESGEVCSQTYKTNELGGQYKTNKQTNDKKKKTPAVTMQTIQSLRGTFHRTRHGITRNGLCDISFSSFSRQFSLFGSDARASRFLTRRFGKPCAEPAAGIRSAACACAKCFSAG